MLLSDRVKAWLDGLPEAMVRKGLLTLDVADALGVAEGRVELALVARGLVGHPPRRRRRLRPALVPALGTEPPDGHVQQPARATATAGSPGRMGEQADVAWARRLDGLVVTGVRRRAQLLLAHLATYSWATRTRLAAPGEAPPPGRLVTGRPSRAVRAPAFEGKPFKFEAWTKPNHTFPLYTIGKSFLPYQYPLWVCQLIL